MARAPTSATCGPSRRTRFKEAHFATFPPALVEPCIKAGTSEKGVCGECGAPWAREVESDASRPSTAGKPERRSDQMAPADQPELFGAFYDGSAPRLPMDEWVARHRVVVGGAFAGPWDPRRAPMSIEPMRAMSDDRVRIVCVVAPAQLMKTEFAINCAIWAAWYGDDVLFFEPEMTLAEDIVSDRIRPAVLQLRGAGEMSTGSGAKKKRDSKTQLRLPSGGTIYALTPGMKTGDAARAARVVVYDEIDKFGRTDMITVGKSRIRTYGADGKIAVVSTPTQDKNGSIWRLYTEGSRGLWHGRCVHCGEVAGMTWGAVTFDRNADSQWIPGTEIMSCAVCRRPWSEQERVATSAAGQYVHAHPDDPTRTFHIPGPAHILNLTLAGIMEEGAAARREMTVEVDASRYIKWTNEFIAEPWEDDYMGLTAKKLEKSVYALGSRGESDLGEVDRRALLITAGTDIGGNAIYTEWVAWGIDPETRNIMSWGLQYRVIGGAPEDDIGDDGLWSAYHRLIRDSVWRFPHRPGQRFGARKVLVDSGWGERSDLVRDWCRRWYAEERQALGIREIAPFAATVLPLKSQSTGEDRYEFPVAMKRPTKQRGKRVVVPALVNVMSQQLKDMIHQWQLRDGHMPSDGATLHRWPSPGDAFGYTEQWKEEFANFKMVTVRNPRTKDVERRWVPRVEARAEEALDCRVYALAAAHVMARKQPLQHYMLRLANKVAQKNPAMWSEGDRTLLSEAVAELDGDRGPGVVTLREE